MVRVDGKGGSDSLIQVRGLDKTYRRGGEEIDVLQGSISMWTKANSWPSWVPVAREKRPC